MITWLKLHHDLPDDIKLRRFTPQEKWAWVVILCLASKSPERGVISGDDEDIADYCEFNTAQDWLYFKDKLIVKGMLEPGANGGLHVLNWEKRQYEKPSDKPQATRERKRRQRAKQKEEKCHAMSRASHTSVTQSHSTDTYTDPDPESDPNTHVDPFLAQASASSIKSFINPSPNKWNEEALSAWAQLWIESGRTPGSGNVNLKSFIRGNLKHTAKKHEDMLEELSIIRKRLTDRVTPTKNTAVDDWAFAAIAEEMGGTQ